MLIINILSFHACIFPCIGWVLVRVAEADDLGLGPNVNANGWLTLLKEAKAADITASYVDPLKATFPLVRL